MKNPKPNKNQNNSKKEIVRDKETKKLWLEDYLDCFTFKMVPVTEMFLERLGKELVQWALNDEDAIKLSQFYNAKGIHHDTFERWYKNPKFKMAKDLALSIIGNRRELNTLKRKFEAGTNNFMMPHYDPKWKEMIEWRQKMKDESQGNSSTPIHVHLDQYPSSDMVPSKKTPEEVAAESTRNTRVRYNVGKNL